MSCPTRHACIPDKYPGFFGSTGWGDAICVVPWTLWLHYGDRRVLEETLPAMVQWVDFVWSISDGPIVRPPRAWGARGFTFGDWLQPKGPSEKPLPTIGDDAAATIYLYISSALTAKVARCSATRRLAKRMSERAGDGESRPSPTSSSRRPAGSPTTTRRPTRSPFSTTLFRPICCRRRPDYFKATIARADGRIGTGFIGTPALLPALVEDRRAELAAAVFLQEEVPGWLYQVKNGATTIWERWDAIRADGTIFEPAMNSYNHYAYGAVCQWLFESVAGFRPDQEAPGFRHIIFEPTIIPELSPVSAHHDSAAGRIEAGMDGRWRPGDLRHRRARAARAARWCSIHPTRTSSSTARRSPRPAATEVAQPARAGTPQGDIPDRERVPPDRSPQVEETRASDAHGTTGR